MSKEIKEVFCRVCRKSSNEDIHFNKKNQLCNRHYLQIKRHSEPLPLEKERQKNNHICDICGDIQSNRYTTWSHDGEYKGKVLCLKHYKQLLEHGCITDDMPSSKNIDRVCCVCGSKEKVIYSKIYHGMYCSRHYSQLYNLGELKERTKYDRNEYKIENNIAIIYLRNSKHEIVGETIIDLEDLDRVIKYKWTLGTWNYAEAKIDDKSVLMQRLIMNEYRKEYIPDHKNRNTLDNRKSNLRISNKSENAVNSKLSSSNTSGIKGVSWSNRLNQWRSYLNKDGIRYEFGYFKNKNDAVKERLKGELKYFGEFAPQKHLFKEYGISED